MPALQRARRRLRPRRAHHQGRRGRRRVDRQRPEGLDVAGPDRRPGHAARPHRPRRAKHQGITWFAIDMHQPGVEVRPLREMTGHAMFNEVFLDDARVPDDAIIGDLNNGWAVANTTLANERAGLGAGGGGGGWPWPCPARSPASSAARVGDFVAAPRARRRRAEARRRPQADQSAAASCSSTWPRATAPVDGPDDPPGPRPAAHPGRARPLQRRAPQGGQGRRRRHPRHGQHLQAGDERHRAPPARPRPAHRRAPGHAPRLHATSRRRRSTRRRATRSSP